MTRKKWTVVVAAVCCLVLIGASTGVGNLRWWQIRPGDRQGDGVKIQMASTMSGIAGAAACDDGHKNTTTTGCSSGGVTTDVTSSAHGLAPISPADATKFLNGAATPAYAQVKDSDLSVSNVTTNNATSGQHGFLPTLSGSSSDCLHGDGTYSGCSGGGGSGTSPYYFGPALTALDSVSNWSSVNLSCTGCNSTRLNTNAAEQIEFRDSSALNWRLRMENLPATPYTITATLVCNLLTQANSAVCGIYLYDGTKLEGVELLSQSGQMVYRAEQLNSVTSDHASLCTGQYTGNILGRTLNFRIKDDGTTRTFYYSEDDGNTFSNTWGTWTTPGACQETDATGWLTPTKVGYGGVSQIGGSSTFTEIVRLVSWKVTSP
jgi:hypothetical protein